MEVVPHLREHRVAGVAAAAPGLRLVVARARAADVGQRAETGGERGLIVMPCQSVELISR